jgi:hypothetical protein
MFDPFVVRQAYIINYTLAFLPQVVTAPDELRPDWQPISAFGARQTAGNPIVPDIGKLHRLSATSAMWHKNKWRFSGWPRPWVIKADQWQLEWLPDVELPPGSNPSSRLFVHVYPLGVVSVGLATAVGFGEGIEIAPLIMLLKQMTPAKAGGSKPPWLRVVAPERFAGREVNLDGLADIVLGQMREALFESPGSAQVIRRSGKEDEAHLRGHNGGIVELVRVAPQRFDKAGHVAGFRGLVTMRPSWQDIEPDHLLKYRDAQAWTGRTSAWHYAGGLNTVLWNDALPERGRRLRRGYTWRVAAVSRPWTSGNPFGACWGTWPSCRLPTTRCSLTRATPGRSGLRKREMNCAKPWPGAASPLCLNRSISSVYTSCSKSVLTKRSCARSVSTWG